MNTKTAMTASPLGVRDAEGCIAAVKICGISQPEHALLAARHGADMVGLVFAPSRRQVPVETAMQIAQAVATLNRKPLLVGVFVNETVARVLAIAQQVGLDTIQLSGDESPEYVAECSRYYPVIKAARFRAGTGLQDALSLLETYERATPRASSRLRFLVDSYQPGEYGGTGRVANWPLAAELASRYDIVLAGGLDPSNVERAVEQVSPWAVDVSSGVESGGVKDPHLIKKFLLAAKPAFRVKVPIMGAV